MDCAYTPREVAGTPSVERSAFFKKRYLEAPLRVDIEYLRLLTESHKRTDGIETVERRAEDHASVLERLTPVIHKRDRIAANKTRFIRGAVPYANYAAGPFLKELRKQEQDAQQKHAEQGLGGGIAAGIERAATEGYAVLSGKFLITPAEIAEFAGLCEYWEDKCFMEVGDRLWKREFSGAKFIEDGWAIGLYTAPHEPCPEGRLILDFEGPSREGYRAIIEEIESLIAGFRPGSVQEAGKLHFWRAAAARSKEPFAIARTTPPRPSAWLPPKSMPYDKRSFCSSRKHAAACPRCRREISARRSNLSGSRTCWVTSRALT